VNQQKVFYWAHVRTRPLTQDFYRMGIFKASGIAASAADVDT
jgi:hypothetical protein